MNNTSSKMKNLCNLQEIKLERVENNTVQLKKSTMI